MPLKYSEESQNEHMRTFRQNGIWHFSNKKIGNININFSIDALAILRNKVNSVHFYGK